MASVLDGKKLVAIGDSLIHGNKLGPDATWVNKLAARHGMTCLNYGINGNPVAKTDSEPTHRHPPMCVRYADMEDGADYVVVLGGAKRQTARCPARRSRTACRPLIPRHYDVLRSAQRPHCGTDRKISQSKASFAYQLRPLGKQKPSWGSATSRTSTR